MAVNVLYAGIEIVFSMIVFCMEVCLPVIIWLNLLMTLILWYLILEMYLQCVNFLDCEGRVRDPEALKERIFYGGLEHDSRKEVLMHSVIFKH